MSDLTSIETAEATRLAHVQAMKEAAAANDTIHRDTRHRDDPSQGLLPDNPAAAMLSNPLLAQAQDIATRLGLTSLLSPDPTLLTENLELAVLVGEYTYRKIINTLERILSTMSDLQSQIDAMTAELQQIETDLTTATADIETEWAAVQQALVNAANNNKPATSVDVSKLQAALDSLKAGVGKLSADDAAWKQPTPAPAPTPTPSPTPAPPNPAPTPSNSPVYDPGSGLPLLVFVGQGTPESGYTQVTDATPSTPVPNTDGNLYTFDQDTKGQPTTQTSVDFQPFTGTLAGRSSASASQPAPTQADTPPSGPSEANPNEANPTEESLGERVHDIVDEVLHHGKKDDGEG